MIEELQAWGWVKVWFCFWSRVEEIRVKVRVEGSSGFRAIHVCLRSFGFRLSAESPSGFRAKVEKLRVQGVG